MFNHSTNRAFEIVMGVNFEITLHFVQFPEELIKLNPPKIAIIKNGEKGALVWEGRIGKCERAYLIELGPFASFTTVCNTCGLEVLRSLVGSVTKLTKEEEILWDEGDNKVKSSIQETLHKRIDSPIKKMWENIFATCRDIGIKHLCLAGEEIEVKGGE